MDGWNGGGATPPSVTILVGALRDRPRAVIEQSRTRARRARLLPPTLQPLADPPRDPYANAEATDLRARLAAALATLSEKERTAVLMREEGFSHREIADAVDTTTGSVGTLLARALAKLAERLPRTVMEA